MLYPPRHSMFSSMHLGQSPVAPGPGQPCIDEVAKVSKLPNVWRCSRLTPFLRILHVQQPWKLRCIMRAVSDVFIAREDVESEYGSDEKKLNEEGERSEWRHSARLMRVIRDHRDCSLGANVYRVFCVTAWRLCPKRLSKGKSESK